MAVSNDRSAAALLAALMKLRGGLDGTPLGLDTPMAAPAREMRRELVEQLEDYVLPRLVQLDAPLLAVVGGSTGAGKSTLVNTLVGKRVTEAGVLRPTTRSPILVYNPVDADWFAPDRILPDLARTSSSSSSDIRALRLVAADTVPQGLAILDAPDVDSIDEANRALAAQLLAAADLWLFVTSATRYADQVPWNFLHSAAERSAAVAIVLDRTPQETLAEVRVHLARMLTARGLKDSPLFSVLEGTVDAEGLLEREAVEPILDWLRDLAADEDIRSTVIGQTLDGTVRQIGPRAHDIADAVVEQVDASLGLHTDVETVYAKTEAQVAAATEDGTLLRGEVLARWQEFVGAGELIRSLDERVGRIRDRILDSVRGRRNRSDEVKRAIDDGLCLLLLEHAESAAEQTERSWASTRPGRALLHASGGGLDRASASFGSRAEHEVREWQAGVLDLVRAEVADKRMTSRYLALGVNGLGIALMIVVFTRTAGGARASGDAGAVGGSAAVGQDLLRSIFGEQTVLRLAQRAHADLVARSSTLLGSEKLRYLDLLGSVETPASAGDTIRGAARAVEDARHGDLLVEPATAMTDE